jgi:hypothetical protein
MGQMTYDNLHWNKVFKDLGMLMTRSVGWNLGTLRELGGGAMDALKWGNALRQGKGAEFTNRMAYTMALPLLAGTLGAAVNYMATGKWPEELKDYFYPKTGGINPDGSEARMSQPNYMKDVFAYGSHPLTTLANKVHPLISAVLQMMANKDYYGIKIANEDDKWQHQALSELKFVGKTAVPFSITGTQKMLKSGASPLAVAGSMVGFGPASGSITQSAAMSKAGEFLSDRLKKEGGRTQAEADRSQARQAAIQALRQHDPSVAQKAIKDGSLHPSDYRTLQREALMTPLQARAMHLDPQEIQRVLEVATPAERKELQPVISKKQTDAAKTEQRQEKMSTVPAGYSPFAPRRR